jgi:hypothetical protein
MLCLPLFLLGQIGDVALAVTGALVATAALSPLTFAAGALVGLIGGSGVMSVMGTTATVVYGEAAVMTVIGGLGAAAGSLWGRSALPLALPGAAAIALGQRVPVTTAVSALPPVPAVKEILEGAAYLDWLAAGVRPDGDAGDAGGGGGGGCAGAGAGAGADLTTYLPVYVGGFKVFKYHGEGRMYLPRMRVRFVSQEVECPNGFLAFEGHFSEGRFTGRGTVFSPLRGGAVATVSFTPDGQLNRCASVPVSVRRIGASGLRVAVRGCQGVSDSSLPLNCLKRPCHRSAMA